MRQLIVLRGPMGGGKSTFAKMRGLEPYMLSVDNIRSMFSAPIMKEDGRMSIDGSHEKKVWTLLSELLEERMKRGDLTVVDATHVKTSAINKYRELCRKYRYRCVVVNFEDVTLEQSLENNRSREEYKFVPEAHIMNAHERMITESIPSWVTVVKPENFDDYFVSTPNDYSHYKKIHHIGDIQGCYTALRQYLEYNGGIKDDELYIFTGDYLDRGLENLTTLAFFLENYKRSNFILLEGNHEKHLRNWAHGESHGRAFDETKLELERADLDLKEVRQLIRKMRQCVFYTNGNYAVLVTHGGLPKMPQNLNLIATDQLINGVGSYEDDVDAAWHENNPEFIQIHGHRNIFRLPTQASPTSFNLEGRVEHGGQLRAVQITGDKIEVIGVENKVYKKPTVQEKPAPARSVAEMVEQLRAAETVRESVCTERISSFNFTEKAFKAGTWDELNTKARGLFIDVENNNIIARSYDKFFNIGERKETSMSYLSLNLKFPLVGYTKPNGYLGILGYDPVEDRLVFASKSQTGGDYAKLFEDIFLDHFTQDQQYIIKTRLKERPATAVFEVIVPDFDPHIIKYDGPKLVLLDVIQNSISFKRRMDYTKLVDFANLIGCEVKQEAVKFDTWLDFYAWYKSVKDDYSIEEEGYVFEDANTFMFKLKLPYYKLWKDLRGVKSKVESKHAHQVRTGGLTTPLHNRFFAWLKRQDKDTLKEMSIIQAREAFFEDERRPSVPKGVLTNEERTVGATE